MARFLSIGSAAKTQKKKPGTIGDGKPIVPGFTNRPSLVPGTIGESDFSDKQGIGENCPFTTIRLSVKNSIIPKNQHGFVPKNLQFINLFECLNDWTCNFDSNIPTDVVYLDYSKCFDRGRVV